MKIDLPELERKLSYGINLTIKESTILLESMEGFIDDKIELQEQLNTTKKALVEIAEIIDDNIHECNYGCDNSCELNGSLDMYSVENVQSVIDSALAAIGWGGCPVGAVGKNGLTKEEIEGSGDE